MADMFSVTKAGKRLSQLSDMLLHPQRHRDLGAILQRAFEVGLISPDRSIAWRYLGNYLSRDLDSTARSGVLADHYDFLLRLLHDANARTTWRDGITVW